MRIGHPPKMSRIGGRLGGGTSFWGQSCPVGPRAARWRPKMASAATPLTMPRLALYTACRGVKTPRKRCTATCCLQRWPAQCARRLFTSTPKAKQALGVFWSILAVPRKKTRFRPILTHFEAIFWPPPGRPRANRAALGPKMGYPLRADHLSWTFSAGVQFSGGGLFSH